jgi:pullulanase
MRFFQKPNPAMMFRLFLILLFVLALASFMRLLAQNKQPQTEFNYPVYTGSDLGMTYTPSGCSFKVWSPSSVAVRLHLYTAGEGGMPERTYDLLPDKSTGLWHTQISGDQKGRFYTIQIPTPGGSMKRPTPMPKRWV